MGSQSLTEYQRQLWRSIVAETVAYETSPAQSSLESFQQSISQILEKEFTGKIEFLKFLIHQPHPVLWPVIADNLKTTQDPSGIEILHEIANSPHPIRMSDPNSIYEGIQKVPSDLREYVRKILVDLGQITREMLLTTKDGKVLREVYEKIPKKAYIDVFWERIRRNYDYFTYNNPIPPEAMKKFQESGDEGLISFFADVLIMKMDSEINQEILEEIPHFLLAYECRRGKRFLEQPEFFPPLMEVFSNHMYSVTWLLEEFIPFCLIKYTLPAPDKVNQGTTEPQRLAFFDVLRKQIENQAALKHIIILSRLVSKEFGHILGYDLNERKVVYDERNKRMVYMDTPGARHFYNQLTTSIGNKLVQTDPSLKDTVDPLFSDTIDLSKVSNNLKITIEQRNCCKTNGRAGHFYCEVCGRVIPKEFRDV